MKTKEIKSWKKKIDNYWDRLDISIKKRKKIWTENNIVEMIANLSIFGKYLTNSKSPSDILDKADKLIDEWYDQKCKDTKKDLSVDKFYDFWAKRYDKDPNLAIFLEEKLIKSFIGNVKNKDILDLGCGTGRYTLPLAKKGANVVGVDFSKAMLKKAKIKAKQTGVKVELINEDITKYSPKKKFDTVLSMLVQGHIKNIDKLIENISKASKLNTEVIISNLHPEVTRKALSKKNKESKAELIPGFRTDHFHHPISEYVKLFDKYGFYLTNIKDLLFEEKYAKRKEFKYLEKNVNKRLFIIMKFKKL